MANYYQVLGIQKTATQAQVKSAYKGRIAEWNKRGGQDMTEYMLIEEAYENLGDELRRDLYNERLPKEDQREQENWLHSGRYDEPEEESANAAYRDEPVAPGAVQDKAGKGGIGKKVVAGGISAGVGYGIIHLIMMVHSWMPTDNTPDFSHATISFDTSDIRKADSFLRTRVSDSGQVRGD